MPASCKDIREALAQCLLSSDCVLIHRNTPSACLAPPLVDTLPTTCQQLKRGYTECKRGQIDMRKRFRGNKPVASSVEIEAGGGKQNVSGGGMLYAGKGSFEGVDPKATDGRELQGEGEKYTRNDGIEDVLRK